MAARNCVSCGAAPVGLPRQQRWPVEERRQQQVLHEQWPSAAMPWPAGATVVSQRLTACRGCWRSPARKHCKDVHDCAQTAACQKCSGRMRKQQSWTGSRRLSAARHWAAASFTHEGSAGSCVLLTWSAHVTMRLLHEHLSVFSFEVSFWSRHAGIWVLSWDKRLP